jgi:hypothetical protein
LKHALFNSAKDQAELENIFASYEWVFFHSAAKPRLKLPPIDSVARSFLSAMPSDLKFVTNNAIL